MPSDKEASYVIGLGLMQALAHAAPDVPVERYPELAARYQHHYKIHQTDISLFNGVLPLLSDLKSRDYILTVATNGDEASSVASLSLDCPLCSTAHAPPPAVQPLALLHQPLAYRLQPQVAARIAALTAPPLPARGPPYSL